MTKYQIVRFMSGWAIRRYFDFWIFTFQMDFIRHGDFWPPFDHTKQNKVMEFSGQDEASEFLKKQLLVRKDQIL